MNYLVDLREKAGLTRKDLANYLGVSMSTVSRWEKGENNPSKLAVDRIKELEKHIKNNELHLIVDKIKIVDEVKNIERIFKIGGSEKKCSVMPYVSNAPEDQKEFHEWLITIQEHQNPKINWNLYKKRLSLISNIEGENTYQYNLEKPKNIAKSWSANYSTHGWHRYVGRFPSQLIRAILNYFEATEDDLVLDPFSGSGTTLVECRLIGIPAVGIEISPLSALISRTKSKFKGNSKDIISLINEMEIFYLEKLNDFLDGRSIEDIHYLEIINRKGNFIKEFANYNKWFTVEALLGVSIITEFINSKNGYEKDLLIVALSAKMRSIGNVDVDVVRAEYSKIPRMNVDVLKLMKSQLIKMAKSITESIETHKDIIGSEDSINVIQGDVLQTDLKEKSISYIITSPPYGVESISYLRTHLLSFRTLEYFLGIDPYNFGDKVIGSEYLYKDVPDIMSFTVNNYSKTFNNFFKKIFQNLNGKKNIDRAIMMMKFFEDMNKLAEKFDIWLKDNGRIAFIIGNKRIADYIIPTDKIIEEIFKSHGFVLEDSINHKLKSNNSNSKVPWQERIIENEFMMFFRRG